MPIRVLQKGMTLYCTPEAKAVSVAALRFKGKTLGRIAKYADSYWISRVTARVVLPGKVLSLAVIAAWLEKFFDGLVLVRSDVAKSMGLTAPMVARILTSEGLIKGMCVPLPARYFPAGVCVIASEVKTEWSATQSDYALCWIPGTAALTKEKAVMSLQSILMLLGAEVNSKEFFDLVKGYIEYAKTRLPDFLQGLEDEADDFLADSDEAAKVEDHRNGVLAKLLGAMRIPVLPFRMLSQNLVGTLSKNIEPGSMKIAPATEKGSDLWATYPMPILWPMLAAAWTAEGQHNEEVATKAKQTMELETKTADGRLIVYCTNFARWAKNNAVPGIAVFFRNPTGETSGTVAEIRELPEHLRIFIIGVNGRMVQMFTTVSEDTRVLLLQANEGMDYDDRCPTARGALAKLIEKGLAWRAALAEKAKANEAKRKERNAHRAAMVAGIPNSKNLWNRLNAATILGQAFKVKTKSFVITSVEEPEIPVEATTEGMSHDSLYDAVMNMEENVFSKAIGIVANAKIFGMALAVGWVKLPDFLEELREEISETLLFSVMLSDIVDAAIKMVGYAEAWASYRMVQVYQVWLDQLTEGKAREGWAFVPAVLRKLSLGAKSLFIDPAKRVTVMDEDLQPLYENGAKVTAPLRDADGNIVTHLMAGELTSKVYTLWAEYRQWCVEEVEALANAQWTAGRQNVLHQTLTEWLGRREDEAVGEETLAWLYWNWDPGFKNLQAWVNQVLIHKIMAPAGYESNRRHKIVSAMLAGSNMSRGKKAMWLAYSAMPIRVAMASVSEEIHAFAMKNFDSEDQEAAHRMAWLAFANRYLQPAEKGKKHSKDGGVEALEIQITEDANGNLKVSGGIATTAFFVGGPWDYLVDWMESVGIGMVNDRDDSAMGEARQLALYLGKGSSPEVRADAEAMLASLKGGDLATMVDTKTSLGWGIDSLLTLPGIKISDGREANGFKAQLASISEIGRQIELRRINKAEVLRKAIDAVYAEAKKAKKPVNTAKLAQAEAELAYFHASTLAELADTFGFMDRLRELFPATAVKAEIVEADWLTEFNPEIKTKDENGNVVMGKTVAIGTRFAPQGKNAFLVLTFKSENHGPNGGGEEDLNGFFVNEDDDCEDCQDYGDDTEESYVGDDSDYEVVDSPEDMPEPSEGDDFDFGDEDENFNPDQYGEDEEEECVASDEDEKPIKVTTTEWASNYDPYESIFCEVCNKMLADKRKYENFYRIMPDGSEIECCDDCFCKAYPMAEDEEESTPACEVCEGAGCRICTAACEDCKVEGDFIAGLCPECEEKANRHCLCDGSGCPLCLHFNDEVKTSVPAPAVFKKGDKNTPADAVYVGRPSQWGNPFVIGKDGTREEVVAKYEAWVKTQPALLANLGNLAGKSLVCHCAPEACHADVLLRLANAQTEAEETEHFFVAFTGHRPDKIGGYNPKSEKRIWVREQIQAQLERGLAKHGEKLWVITGGALGVDQDAAEIAHEMGIPFSVFIPCAEQEAMWPREAKNRYYQMLEVASEIVEVGKKPYTEDKFCMQRRNMEMVDCADIVIAVWDGSDGGTKNAVAYAEESGVKIIFIDPSDFEAEVEEKPAPAPSEKKTGIAFRLNRITGKK